jgi:hypothetical protein
MRFSWERLVGWLQRWPVLAGALAYCAITAVAGQRVLAHPSANIAHDNGDPLLTAALLHWNAWTVPFTQAWWQFPIFHPTPDALAFSEHLLGLSVVATPVEWLLRDPMAAANVATLLTYPLCGVMMMLLVRRLTGSAAAGFLAGLAFAFAPYRAAQLAHLQMLAGFWAPMALLGLHTYLDSGRSRWLVVYGAGWLLQALANLYSLFFFSILVGFWVLWFVVAPRRWTALRDIAIATLGAAIPLAPTLATYMSVHARNGFERSAGEAMVFSADLGGVLCAAPETALWHWLQVSCRPEAAIFPGLVTAILAGVAVWRLGPLRNDGALSRVLRIVRRLLATVAVMGAAAAIGVALVGPWRIDISGLRVSASSIDKPLLVCIVAGLLMLMLAPGIVAAVRQRSTIGFYLCGAFVMWLFALGPTIVLLDVPRGLPGPYRLLSLLPGGDGLRAPGRFWLMATLCLAVVVGLVAGELLARRRPRAAWLLAALLAVGLTLDGFAVIPVASGPVPYPDEGALRGQIVMHLPVGHLQDFGPQYLAVTGGWRSVNGYSGYEPRFYEALRQGSRFEVDGLFEPFRTRDDIYVIVNADQPRLRTLVERQPGAALVGDRRGVLQYRLPRQPRPAAAHVLAAPVRITGATASCAGTEWRALDANLETRWVCGPQRGAEWFVVDLGAASDRVSAVRYVLGNYYREFPRMLAVETSLDGDAWEPAWSGDVIAATIEGSLADPLTAPATVWFAPRRARYVRLRQTGRDDDTYWSLAELAVLAGSSDQSAKGY